MWVVAKPLLSFLTGPAGRVLLFVLAFLVWGLYQRVDATADCEDAQLREELAESNRQLQIANGIAEDARGRADAAEGIIENLKGLADELSVEIQAEGRGCTLDPATIERLRRIR